ncbi:extracellular solute-binding protein [Paenibacillus psychroresistens]|uniref:Extracellular solute-binding protein n=1 Tax=Paenibacillus psychroresistens TaxID=1778678 RepID=A0A6B8RQZ1_9BACL|nr:extracellular solute-binding protein [Paenibacillus psychroresistens]QGQ97698.1 extracellular solute-binding protein [Paenibacillus psychroresistens]
MIKKSGLILITCLMITATACSSSSTNSESSATPAASTNSASPSASTPAEGSGKVTNISMQIAWASDSGRGKAIQGMLDQFEIENPTVKVELLGGVQYGQKLLTQIISGEAPEVLQVAYGDAKPLATQGAFIDLTKDFGVEKENYMPQIWDLAVNEGMLSGMPWLGHTIQLIYNKTLFEKAGIKAPPQTWDELYEVAKKLTIDTNGDGKPDQFGIGLSGKQGPDLAWMYGLTAAQAGAKLVTEKNGQYEVAINSPEGIKALDFYTKLMKDTSPTDSLNKDGGAIQTDFRNQVVAMELSGPWGVSEAWKTGGKFEAGVAEVPSGPVGKATEVTTYLLSIPTGVEGDKLAASEKLIKYLTSKPAQEMVMKGEVGEDGKYYPFRIPIRKDMADTQFFKDHPEFNVFMKGVEYPFILNPIPQWTKISDEVYQSALNQVVSGKISSAEGLKMVQDKGNAIIKNSK